MKDTLMGEGWLTVREIKESFCLTTNYFLSFLCLLAGSIYGIKSS